MSFTFQFVYIMLYFQLLLATNHYSGYFLTGYTVTYLLKLYNNNLTI